MTGGGAGAGQADLLETIVASTRRTVEVRQAREGLDALARRAEERAARPGAFRAAVSRAGRANVIAECKRRSPSKGVLRQTYDPVAIAAGYAQAGAAAISVLTEPTFFDGALEHLAAVRKAVSIPLLRKDFVVSEYQLYEARANGADAVLLIVAALSASDLESLLAAARRVGLDTLVEVHDARELEIALAVGADVIGVNNRNLRTLTVDVGLSERLIDRMPAGSVGISESGLKSADDIARLRALGYRGFLIGERFMVEPDPGAALAALLSQVPA